MGDEIGLLNDHSYEADPNLAHDGRWMHRPRMDWNKARRAEDPATIEGRILAGIRHIIARRRVTPHLHAANPTLILESGIDGVFAFKRESPGGALVCLLNFTGRWQLVPGAWLRDQGASQFFDMLGNSAVSLKDDGLALPPEGRVWLA
jgi:amylosucrase